MADGQVLLAREGQRLEGAGMTLKPAGHEHFLAELGDVVSARRPPDQDAIAQLRARHDIRQLTPSVPGRSQQRNAVQGGGQT